MVIYVYDLYVEKPDSNNMLWSSMSNDMYVVIPDSHNKLWSSMSKICMQ